MSACHARRGRPKGSGLDDRKQLRRIEQLLDADPALKPTTAIKSLGISDPATIRRLRDKLRAARPAPVRSEPAPKTAGTLSAAVTARHERGRRTAAAASASTPGLAVAAPVEKPEAAEWLVQWFGVGIGALTTTVEAQMSALETLLRVPQVASMVRHQLVLNEHLIALCLSRSDVRKTLH